ncbi:hypothetical protein [Anaerosporomusa subterranea]|jgi:hypothetical protein|nr:hypothetical protein [Anaerosporomusa subterranea]
MFQKKRRQPMFDLDMDMNMGKMAKLLFAGAMVYLGSKMISDEMRD